MLLQTSQQEILQHFLSTLHHLYYQKVFTSPTAAALAVIQAYNFFVYGKRVYFLPLHSYFLHDKILTTSFSLAFCLVRWITPSPSLRVIFSQLLAAFAGWILSQVFSTFSKVWVKVGPWSTVEQSQRFTSCLICVLLTHPVRCFAFFRMSITADICLIYEPWLSA